MRHVSMTTLRTVALAGMLAGCGDLPTGVATADLGHTGLVQTVTLSAVTVAVGDSLRIRSVVTNRGLTTDTVSNGCMTHGMGLEGVEFAWPNDITCEGFWVFGLEPGDSLVREIVTAPITSPPGDYQLGVYQLIAPSEGAYVRLKVISK